MKQENKVPYNVPGICLLDVVVHHSSGGSWTVKFKNLQALFVLGRGGGWGLHYVPVKFFRMTQTDFLGILYYIQKGLFSIKKITLCYVSSEACILKNFLQWFKCCFFQLLLFPGCLSYTYKQCKT